MTSPYLLRPLRSFGQALRDRQRRIERPQEPSASKSNEAVRIASIPLDDGHDAGYAKRE
jgi:hypothetical protein